MPKLTYTLTDAVAQHTKYPDTFRIPEASDRESLKAGDCVKLMFESTKKNDPFTERMWVEITERHGNGSYTGKLDNDPVSIKIKHGDVVSFEPRHIINIHP